MNRMMAPIYKTITVDLFNRSYPIYLGKNLLLDPKLLAAHIDGNRVTIISDDIVAPLYLPQLEKSLDGIDTTACILKSGEESKSLNTLGEVFDHLVEHKMARDNFLIVLGGGVIGDIGGFAAACYQRGIPFIQIPTTLLAQVDSSVGGKTGVNHPGGKNMLGAFYQPQAVLVDIGTLDTLDNRQLRCGIAEIVKYGLIQDADFFSWLEQSTDALLNRDYSTLCYAIEKSCRHKAMVVSQDEYEGGIRALLNLGHTFGHAIENILGYGTWLHGEAVAAGLCMAADLSKRLSLIDELQVGRIRKLIRELNLPDGAPIDISTESMVKSMARDKKVQQGNLKLILLRNIGEAFICDNVDEQQLRNTLDLCRLSYDWQPS